MRTTAAGSPMLIDAISDASLALSDVPSATIDLPYS